MAGRNRMNQRGSRTVLGGTEGEIPPVYPTLYDRNFKPQIVTDITMPVKQFVAQILART